MSKANDFTSNRAYCLTSFRASGLTLLAHISISHFGQQMKQPKLLWSVGIDVLTTYIQKLYKVVSREAIREVVQW